MDERPDVAGAERIGRYRLDRHIDGRPGGERGVQRT